MGGRCSPILQEWSRSRVPPYNECLELVSLLILEGKRGRKWFEQGWSIYVYFFSSNLLIIVSSTLEITGIRPFIWFTTAMRTCCD